MDFLDELSQYSKKQIDFLLAMLETGNISKSAKIAQITETTAFKYLKDGLKEKLEEIRKKYLEANFKKLEFASIKATEVVIDILEDKECPKSIKLNAGKTILDYGLKIREQTEIIDRLKNIEKRIEKSETRNY